VIVDTKKGTNLIVARGAQLKEALAAKGVLPSGEHDVDDDDDDQPDPFEQQQAAFETANQSIAASAIVQLVDSPSVWRTVATKMLSAPAARQMKIADMAGMPEVIEYATGWESGAREMVAAVKDPMMLRRLIASAALIESTSGELDEELSQEDPADMASSVYVFRSPDFDVVCDEVGVDAPALRAGILAQTAEPVSDPSVAAQAEDQTAEPAAPAKPKRARKAKAAAPKETQEQVGSADVDEGAEVTHG